MTMSIDVVGPTSLGTGTTKTLIGGGNLVLPGWARSIVAIIPTVSIAVPTAAQSVITKVSLESDDFTVGPFEVPAAPLGSFLGALSNPGLAKAERYLVNCPVNGGDQLKIYGQALVLNTGAPSMSVAVVVSDQPPGGSQRFAKMGVLTATGLVASTEVAGTLYSFSKARRIVELLAVVAPTTVAAAEDIHGHIRYSSSEFEYAGPLKLPYNPVIAGLGATTINTIIDGVSRAPVDFPIKAGTSQTNIQDYFTMNGTLAVAGYFVTGVIFE